MSGYKAPMYKRYSQATEPRDYFVTRIFTKEQIEHPNSRYRSKLENNALKQIGLEVAENHVRKKVTFIYRNSETSGLEYHSKLLTDCPNHLELDCEEHSYKIQIGEQL